MKAKKLKSQYKTTLRFPDDDHRSFLDYPNLRNWYYRSFSTKQEKSCAILHAIECREMSVKVRIRERRGKSLPSDWDDFKSTFHYVKKCWKHNSKRAHQYYKEKRA